MSKSIFGLCLLLLVLGLSVCQQSQCGCKKQQSKNLPVPKGKSGISIIYPDNGSNVKGYVSFYQQSRLHPVRISFAIIGLSKFGEHGIHIHEFGDLLEGCKTAGPHFNPFGHTHGGPCDRIRHAGDLGNLKSDGTGVAQYSIVDNRITLYGQHTIFGRSIVIHKLKDDLGKGGNEESLLTGNAGPRLACGVIGQASIFKHFNRLNIK